MPVIFTKVSSANKPSRTTFYFHLLMNRYNIPGLSVRCGLLIYLVGTATAVQVLAKTHTLKKNFLNAIIFFTTATCSAGKKIDKMHTIKKAPMMDANE